MVSKVLIKRTSTDNQPPATLDPGELAVEMGTPTRLWVGVPAALGAPGNMKQLTPSGEPPIAPGLITDYWRGDKTWQPLRIGTVTPQGRLTLASNRPVMDATVASATTVYYTPYCGNLISIFDGVSTFIPMPFTEMSFSIAGATPDRNIDWFVVNSGGNLVLTPVDWVDDYTRAGPLMRVSGIWLNSVPIGSNPAQTATYVGTTRTNAAGTIDWIYGTKAVGGGASFLGVWNCYNRVAVATSVAEETGNWTLGANTPYRPFNNSVNNSIKAVFGLAEDAVDVTGITSVNCPEIYATVAVALNGTIQAPGFATSAYGSGASWNPCISDSSRMAPEGFHTWMLMETSANATQPNQFAGTYSPINCGSGITLKTRM